MKRLIYLFFTTLLISSCSNNKFSNRMIASKDENVNLRYIEELKKEARENSHTLEFPPGVNAIEQFKMWHLSEGSDIYPTHWLLNLKSFLSNKKGTLFFDDLNSKYGVVKSPYAKDEISPFSWVGLTAVWDGEDKKYEDLLRSNQTEMKNLPKVIMLKSNKPAIAMTGANCAFCHTGSVIDSSNPAKRLIIDGAPATIEMKGFFYDIIGSTYQTMFDKKELSEFYERLNVKNGQEKAFALTTDLKKEMGVEDSLINYAITLLGKAPVIGKKINKEMGIKVSILLYEKKEVLTKYLIRMLQETYDLKEVTPLMKKRMEYLTWFGAPNPDVFTTPEGYGRTDAFGRISNATVRLRSYIKLTAPVSLPPMYGMKYKAFFHYNANTNSLVSRNVGQAFGLGAIVTGDLDEKGKLLDSTVNVHNLIELEKLINKVPVPEFVKFFPNQNINKEQIVKGCEVYLTKCVQCHEANPERVGPTNSLIDHKMIEADIINTDKEYTKNISKAALGLPFRKALFDFNDKVKDGYYAKNGIDLALQKEYAQEETRGPEFFRDTFLGENRFAEKSISEYGNIIKGKSFVARHLSGVWSAAPFLHNGSVPNLYELLLPEVKRSKKFIVGNLNYDIALLGFKSTLQDHPYFKDKLKWKLMSDDPCYDVNDPFCFDTTLVGNSNVGHSPAMYGGELKNSEKMALIEFLKVLTPEAEYSWSDAPVYKIENNKCALR
ncbi:MAG: hypothetical protein K2Q18_15705 [Bdellovibrionales bacterium]|nr:hypothetical protein [Bdellovibrionales bacterium]